MLQQLIARCALALLVTVPLVAQFPGDPPPAPGGAGCSWVAPPSLVGQLCNTTVFGPFTITVCFKLWFGHVECQQQVCTEICIPGSPGGIFCIALPPLWIPFCVTVPPTSPVYEEDCVTVTTITPTFAVEVCEDITYAGGGPTTQSYTVGSHVNLAHDVPNATSATFDGAPLAPGQVVHLCEHPPGPHSYVVTVTGHPAPVTYTIDLMVEQSFPMKQTDNDPAAHVLPSATFEFTNESPHALDLHLEVEALSPSLVAKLLNNQVHVLPGQRIERTVTFTTLPGAAVPEGAPLLARVDAFAVSPDHMKLNSLVITAGSCEQTAGSGEDLHLETEVGDSGAMNACAKIAMVGADFSLVVASPNGTFLGAPTVVYFDTFTLGQAVLPALPAFPELHLSAGAQPLASTGALTATGFAVSVGTPALVGAVLRLQAVALSTSAANGTFAISDAHDVTVY